MCPKIISFKLAQLKDILATFHINSSLYAKVHYNVIINN
jgi:hypothetical protein